MPKPQHVANVLEDAATLQRDGHLTSAGVMYVASLRSWLDAASEDAVAAAALQHAWEAEDRAATVEEVEQLREAIVRLFVP